MNSNADLRAKATPLWSRPPEESVETLDQLGAHFVLSDRTDPRRPLWAEWQKPSAGRPSLPVVLYHARIGWPIGLIPASLSETVLDFDRGGREAVSEFLMGHPPRLDVETATPGHLHAYYDGDPRDDSDFHYGELGGQIKSRGFVMLWGDALDELAHAMRRGGRFWFPVDLFDAAGLPPARVTTRGPRPNSSIVRGDVAGPGTRNRAMFDHVRQWAYRRAPDYDTLSAFHDAALARARGHRDSRQMPPIGDLPRDRAADVQSTAWSVASWVWPRRHTLRTPRVLDPEYAAARRSKGGAMRARAIRAERLSFYRAVAEAARTRTYSDVAQSYGLSGKGEVSKIINRRLPVAEVEHLRCQPNG